MYYRFLLILIIFLTQQAYAGDVICIGREASSESGVKGPFTVIINLKASDFLDVTYTFPFKEGVYYPATDIAEIITSEIGDWSISKVEKREKCICFEFRIAEVTINVYQGVYIENPDDAKGKESVSPDKRGGYVRFQPDTDKPNIRYESTSCTRSKRSGTCNDCGKLLIDLLSFSVPSFQGDDIYIKWVTGAELNNTGFRLWRATKEQYTNYKPILLKEFSHPEQVNPELDEDCSTKIQGQLKVNNSNQYPKLISTIGNSTESTCYSFADTSNLSDGTYYYLLEDIDDSGDSTFHCNQIDAVTIGQGPAIDLESAINYCKEVTGSNN